MVSSAPIIALIPVLIHLTHAQQCVLDELTVDQYASRFNCGEVILAAVADCMLLPVASVLLKMVLQHCMRSLKFQSTRS